jgi:hypothetical protein
LVVLCIFVDPHRMRPMHSTPSHRNASSGFTTRVRRILFGWDSGISGAFATACAKEVRGHRGLSTFIVSLAVLSRGKRFARLLETAAVFRGEWATSGLADTLTRMAKRPALFRAVVGLLHAEPAHRPSFTSPIAEAA